MLALANNCLCHTHMNGMCRDCRDGLLQDHIQLHTKLLSILLIAQISVSCNN